MNERTLVYEFPIAIRWGDMDAMGHVNNTMYFRYMEQCRISWFEALGIGPDPNGEGPVIVNASCEFRRELVYPGTVLVRQWVGDIGTSSFQTWLTLSRSDDPGTVSAEGAARVVWVDFPRRKSAPLPGAVRTAIVRPVGGLV
jgi:acyl-CoA thioester hydrolase